MLRRLGYLIRKDERRATVTAFAFHAMFVGSYTVLETARDALFLSKIQSSRLPVVYVAIAFLSFFLARVQRVLGKLEKKRELLAWVAIAAVGTSLLGAIGPSLGHMGLYVLYVWAGVVGSLVLVHFWTLLGTVFTATQAKRLYGVVTLGSMVGAIGGSAIVTGAASMVSGRVLVFLAASGFASALVPAAMLTAHRPAEPESQRKGRIAATLAFAVRAPYVKRLLALNVAATIAITLADYAFKTTLAASVHGRELAPTLGRIYLTLNITSFVVQMVAVGVILRKVSPPRIAMLLPIGLALGGGGLALGGGLVAALAIKGVDGTLRYSLHKTALELLLVPLTEEQRRRAKALLDTVGQRGGQVVASGIIVGVAALGLAVGWLGWVLVATAILWVALALGIAPRYVEQFRASIAVGASRKRIEDAPALDVASLETLVASLDSGQSKEVLAALRIMEIERKTHLIPALILYHPDEEVVIAALRLFSRVGKQGALGAIDHLLDRGAIRVRAEAAAARAAIDPDPAPLASRLEREDAAPVRAAILTAMAASGMVDTSFMSRGLDGFFGAAEPATKVVVAEIIGSRRVLAMEEIAIDLSRPEETEEVRLAAVEALGKLGTASSAHALVDRLRFEPLQPAIRAALARAGQAGFTALLAALDDQKLTSTIRWALPRALAAVDAPRAARCLLANLPTETDGMVRYRSIVTLGVIQEQEPKLRLDASVIDEELRLTVSRAYRYLGRRIALTRGAALDATRRTPGYEILVGILADKERCALGRIYRLLALRFPEQKFGDIYRSIESNQKTDRSKAVELTRGLLRPPLRDAVAGLAEDTDDDARLSSGVDFAGPIPSAYEELLASLLSSSSSVVRDIAAYHVAELHLESARSTLEIVGRAPDATPDILRALAVLGGAPSLRGIAFPTAPESVRAS